MNMKPETFVLQITSSLYLLETSLKFRLDLGELLDLDLIFQILHLDEVPDDVLDKLLPLAVACLYINAQNCEDFRYPSPSDMPSAHEDEHVTEIIAFVNRLYASENWYFVRSYMPIQDSMLHYNIDDAIIRRAIPFLELAYHAINIRVQRPTDPNEALYQERQIRRAKQVLKDIEQQKLNDKVASESETPLAPRAENLRDSMPKSILMQAIKHDKVLSGSRSTISPPAILTQKSPRLEHIYDRIHRQDKANVCDGASISTFTPASLPERERVLKKVIHRMHRRKEVPAGLLLESKPYISANNTDKTDFEMVKVKTQPSNTIDNIFINNSETASRSTPIQTPAKISTKKSRIPVLKTKPHSSATPGKSAVCYYAAQHQQSLEPRITNNPKSRIPILSTKIPSKALQRGQNGVQKIAKEVATLGAENYDVETKVPHLMSATMSKRHLGEVTTRSNMTSKLQEPPTRSLQGQCRRSSETTKTQSKPDKAIQVLRQLKKDVGEDVQKYLKASKARKQISEIYGLGADANTTSNFSMRNQDQFNQDLQSAMCSVGEKYQESSDQSILSKLPYFSSPMPQLEAHPLPRSKSSRTIIVEKYLKLEETSTDQKHSGIYGVSNLDRLRKCLMKDDVKPPPHLATDGPLNQKADQVDKTSQLREDTETAMTSSDKKPSSSDDFWVPILGRPLDMENIEEAMEYWRFNKLKHNFDPPVCNGFHCRRYLGKCI